MFIKIFMRVVIYGVILGFIILIIVCAPSIVKVSRNLNKALTPFSLTVNIGISIAMVSMMLLVMVLTIRSSERSTKKLVVENKRLTDRQIEENKRMTDEQIKELREIEKDKKRTLIQSLQEELLLNQAKITLLLNDKSYRDGTKFPAYRPVLSILSQGAAYVVVGKKKLISSIAYIYHNLQAIDFAIKMLPEYHMRILDAENQGKKENMNGAIEKCQKLLIDTCEDTKPRIEGVLSQLEGILESI